MRLIGSLALMGLLAGCGGTTGGTINGKVIDYATGNGLAGVTVKAGDKTATTGSDGKYTITGAAYGNNIVVIFDKTGYGRSAKITALSDSQPSATVDVALLKATERQFDPTAAAEFNATDSAGSVSLGANALVDEDGQAPSGTVTAYLTPIDPAVDIALMPGEMLDDSGNPIESFGAMTVDFKDANGNKLNLADGQTATIRIPASTRNSSTLPATVPLYYFDEEKGAWVKEGTATLKTVNGKQVYEGTVTHFTTWNGDRVYEDTYINGCVEDMEGNRVANARIDMLGFDYTGSWRTTSNDDGNFSVKTKRNAISLVTATTTDGKVSNTVKVMTGEEEKTLNECLVVGTAPLTVRLTWGKDPQDLDTHVVGPNGYHIWYSHKGSFAQDNAYLDVDDTDGYGPEVYTVRKFTEPGTYHYAVYHYRGSSTISASPARVEVILDGEKTIFVPPAGQTVDDMWWNVFDIVVDDQQNVSIRSVQTWAHENDGPTSEYR
jgi:hypothetical protein